MPHAAHNKIEHEIIELHEFFVEWFRGECDGSDRHFDERFTSRFPPDFDYVLPGGELLRLGELTSGLRGAYASSPEFQIMIRNVDTRGVEGSEELALVNYRELQKGALNSSPNNGRVSSAVMQLAPSAPNGVVWLHLHETWLPEEAFAQEPFDF